MVRKIKYITFFVLVLLIIFGITQCQKETNEIIIPGESASKINGISFTGPGDEVDASVMNSIANINSNWVCLMPFAFGRPDSTWLGFDHEFQWWGEKTEGIIACTNYARQKGLQVMLKPHVWFWHGFFTGDFELHSEEEWITWENNYSSYILHFAQLADSLKIPLFCVGVEFKNFIDQRPSYWNELIDSVRQIYGGELVYAANWDNFDKITFWEKLDYIGVDAYFPLSAMQTPHPDSLQAGWKDHYLSIKALSESKNKAVLFTEFGYKSVDYTALEPWNPVDGNVNLIAQQNAMESVFLKFWDKSWFAGGFVWKWYYNHEFAGGYQSIDYTPQNKPAENTVSFYFEKYK